eukprot:CCRYP_011282-RD/>CCRYP_011282-RD protein AED:0.48 eAED:1.00 QI:0/0/0/1/0/0/2/0/91
MGCLPNSMPPGDDEWPSVVTFPTGMAVAEARDDYDTITTDLLMMVLVYWFIVTYCNSCNSGRNQGTATYGYCTVEGASRSLQELSGAGSRR